MSMKRDAQMDSVYWGEKPEPPKQWNVGYGSREFARVAGDPILAVVEAETFDEAMEKALRLPLSTMGAGVWVWRRKDDTR